jgi:hypothetical protein
MTTDKSAFFVFLSIKELFVVSYLILFIKNGFLDTKRNLLSIIEKISILDQSLTKFETFTTL